MTDFNRKLAFYNVVQVFNDHSTISWLTLSFTFSPSSALSLFFHQMDWRKFFEDAMRIVNKKITSKEQIVVYAPEYLGNLTELIKEYNSTPEGRM